MPARRSGDRLILRSPPPVPPLASRASWGRPERSSAPGGVLTKNLDIDRVLDDAGTGALGAVLQLFTGWSLWLGIGLIIAAVVSSAMTKKAPWTREASVWLYSMAATACFAVHWAAIPA